MPRYIVERTVPNGSRIPLGWEVLERNADQGVTWIQSYVSDERQKTFCVYEAPTPEAIRKTAANNEPAIDRITEVRVLDPHFYRAAHQQCAQAVAQFVRTCKPIPGAS